MDEPNYPAAEFDTTPYLLYALRASIAAPKPLEDINYPLISEFLFEHRTSPYHFSLYPQLTAKWKPRKCKDQHKEIPDIGVGFFYRQHPFFKVRYWFHLPLLAQYWVIWVSSSGLVSNQKGSFLLCWLFQHLRQLKMNHLSKLPFRMPIFREKIRQRR
jgi:hypothetical protein